MKKLELTKFVFHSFWDRRNRRVDCNLLSKRNGIIREHEE